MFNNLISLTLGEWCTPDEFSPLLYILWRSPLLANLTLNLNKVIHLFSLICRNLSYDLLFQCMVKTPNRPISIYRKCANFAWKRNQRPSHR